MKTTIARAGTGALLAALTMLGPAVTPAPATAATRRTCDTQVTQVTVGGRKYTRLAVTGRPTSNARVYSFRLTWGWTNTVSTYIPRYRAYNAPRHTPLTSAESWVNGYKCNGWFAGTIL